MEKLPFPPADLSPLQALIDLLCFAVSLVVVVCSLTGTGTWTARCMGWKGVPLAHRAVLGWVATILILQVLHLWFPIQGIWVIGFWIFPCLHGARAWWKEAPFSIHHLWWAIPALAWLGSRALLAPEVYDSALYHFASIRWAQEWSIVPGLGNLHFRFAFNQSFFLYAASLDIFWSMGRCLANTSLLLLLVAMLLTDVQQFRGSRRFPALLMIPATLAYVLHSRGWASPTPDTTCVVLQFMLFLLLLRGVQRGPRFFTWERGLLLVLGSAAVTVKLSTLVFVGSVLLIAWGWKPPWAQWKEAFFASSIFAMWAARGVVLSGFPFYPSPWFRFDLPWSLGREQAHEITMIIYAFARNPGADWQKVMADQQWMHPWWMHMLAHRAFLFIVILSTVLSIVVVFTWIRNRRGPAPWSWLTLLPCLAGFAFWFFTAPAPRFANGLFLITPIALLMVLGSLNKVRALGSPWGRLLLFIASLPLLGHLALKPQSLFKISTSGLQPIPSAPLEQRTTTTGMGIWVPREDNRVWYGPLPNTPYPREDLRWLDPADPQKGILISPPSP